VSQEKALLVAPWLAWHLVLPFVQILVFLYSALSLDCGDGYGKPELKIYLLITLPLSFREYMLLYCKLSPSSQFISDQQS